MKTVSELGRDLDACERNAIDCISHDQFDFEDGDGTLRHDADACPICRMAEARGVYFSAIREPVIAAREKLQSTKLTGDLWPEVEKFFGVMRAAQTHYRTLLDLGPDLSTTRERCDAAAAEELSESNYEIISDRWYTADHAREDMLTAEAATRKRSRIERANGVVRIQVRRKPRVRSL
jgi:hypothetical protein